MKDGNMLELDLTDSLTHRTYKETLRTIDNELDYYYCVFPNSKLTFNKIDEMPRFPGGEEWMHRFIAKKIKYPKDAKKNSISGRVVISFNVDTTGYTSDIFVVEGVYPSIDKEAIRVISILPRFVPAVDNGSKVKVNYKIPIVFEQ